MRRKQPSNTGQTAMLLNIPDDFLVASCGGQWGTRSATDIGAIIKNYLYGDKQQVHERRMILGAQLVQVLEKQLDE
jgi:hypothetical protein